MYVFIFGGGADNLLRWVGKNYIHNGVPQLWEGGGLILKETKQLGQLKSYS